MLGNLDARRDWGWAPEYVNALVRAVRHDVPGDYVVATGESHTVRDFVETAFRVAGLDDWRRFVRSNPSFQRPNDASNLVGDHSHARTSLGWEAQTSFEDLVRRMTEHDLRFHAPAGD